MPKEKKRKIRGSKEIKQAIIDFIETLDFPTTTGGIAEGVGLNWYAASFYLGQLKEEGKVFHKRVGRQNQWWTEKVDEQRKKIRELEKDKDTFVIVIKCLVSGAKEFSKIQDKTKLGFGELRRILGELETKGLIEKKENKFRLVN